MLFGYNETQGNQRYFDELLGDVRHVDERCCYCRISVSDEMEKMHRFSKMQRAPLIV